MKNKMNRSPPVKLARDLRIKETEEEQIIWSWLRNKQLNGVKFRRQQPIGNYIVDFVCFEKRLIIEIDGSQHNEAQIIADDETRTKWLESQGFHIIRFWNNDVKLNLDGVISRIKEFLE